VTTESALLDDGSVIMMMTVGMDLMRDIAVSGSIRRSSPDIYIPSLTGKPEQQRFPVQSTDQH